MRLVSDVLPVAVELHAERGVLWSDDMKSGGVVDRRHIVNAFYSRGCLLGMAVPYRVDEIRRSIPALKSARGGLPTLAPDLRRFADSQ